MKSNRQFKRDIGPGEKFIFRVDVVFLSYLLGGVRKHYFSLKRAYNNKDVVPPVNYLLAHFVDCSVDHLLENDIFSYIISHYVYLNKLSIANDTINIIYETDGDRYEHNLTAEQFSNLYLGCICPVLEHSLDARLEKEEQRKLMLFSAGFKDERDNYRLLKRQDVMKNRVLSTYFKLQFYLTN